MSKARLAVIVSLTLALTACAPVERQAYNTIVAAKAFLDSAKASHPECITAGAPTAVCQDLTKATAAKDVLIDAVEVYCSGPAFVAGGACQPPAAGTPAQKQAADKITAAISAYNQTAKDLKGVL